MSHQLSIKQKAILRELSLPGSTEFSVAQRYEMTLSGLQRLRRRSLSLEYISGIQDQVLNFGEVYRKKLRTSLERASLNVVEDWLRRSERISSMSDRESLELGRSILQWGVPKKMVVEHEGSGGMVVDIQNLTVNDVRAEVLSLRGDLTRRLIESATSMSAPLSELSGPAVQPEEVFV